MTTPNTPKTCPDHSDLASWEVNAVIDFFLHHIKAEDRCKLMQALPTTYNKLVGREIMTVTNSTEVQALADLGIGDNIDQTPFSPAASSS